MKIGGLSAIRVRAYVRKRQKEKEMRFAVRGDESEGARRFFERPATRDMRDSTMKVMECQELLYI